MTNMVIAMFSVACSSRPSRYSAGHWPPISWAPAVRVVVVTKIMGRMVVQANRALPAFTNIVVIKQSAITAKS